MSTDLDYKDLVSQKAIAQLYANMGISATALTIIPFLVLKTMWGLVDEAMLFGWFSVAMAMVLVRWLLFIKRNKVVFDGNIDRKWKWLAFSLSLFTGVIWGMSVPLFFPYIPAELKMILGVVAAGLAAGSAVAFNSWLPHFYAFSATELGIIAFYLMYSGTTTGITLGVLFILYLLLIAGLAHNMNRFFRNNLQLRLKNETLVSELRLEKDLAEASSRAKTRFLASASHDLRQPVHALSLLREALGQEKGKIRRGELLGLMENSLDALDQLLGSLLDVSKLDAGVVENKSEPMPLNPLLTAIMDEVRPLAWEKNLKLRLRRCNYNVVSDPNLLGNIIRNLVTNAIRYTERGGVLIACRRRGSRLLIQIWDTGIGIDEKEQENIFQEFTQLHNPERDRNRGLGLGLAICRRLIHLLGHELRVDSRPDRGSVFTIELPVYEGSCSVLQKQKVTCSYWDLYGKQVLLLDDDDMVRQGMLALLERWGCVAISASNAEEAMQLAREAGFNIDVIVSDYRLPGDINGAEVVNLIRAEAGRQIPVVLVTGDTSPERLKDANVSGYPLLHKPVKPAFLRNVLGQVLSVESEKGLKIERENFGEFRS